MNILIIGQCTLQWGRMEFGNIGNFYIMEPFFRLLNEVFPGSEIKTTFQMSQGFCEKENVEVLPMELYYKSDNSLEHAEYELQIALNYQKGKKIFESTPYIDIVKQMDLVIDFSGDIWGDNADFLGEDRFIVGLIKNRVAQIFAKKTVMLAGSPGPFSKGKNLEFAKEVYENFDFVTNRENISKDLLRDYGFDVTKTYSLACPAFRFQPADKKDLIKLNDINPILNNHRRKIGFLICGWNFMEGPFDKWPREDTEYEVFAKSIEDFIMENDVDVYLMSHSNGFPIPPKEFKLIHGRDYPIIKQLQKVIENRGIANNVYALDGIYDAWQSKAILGQFDMVVSGRVHAAVGAMSQNVPTVIIDYGHEPKAHKLKGFAEVAGQGAYLAQPDQDSDLVNKMNIVWENRTEIRINLENKIPEVKALARKNFDLLKTLF